MPSVLRRRLYVAVDFVFEVDPIEIAVAGASAAAYLLKKI
jgi:hypothetical protein